MSMNYISDDQKQRLEIGFETPQQLEWIVQEDPKLQAELNGLSKNGKKLSSKLVHKVVDRIKDL